MDDLTEQSRAAVAAGDRGMALHVLGRIGSGSSELATGELAGLLGNALIATAAANPTAEDAAAIAAYRAAQASLDQILRLIADSPLDPGSIATVRAALRRRELVSRKDEDRQDVADDPGNTRRYLRVGRGWLEAKLIRGYGPYWYWRYREGEVQRSKYLGKAPLDGGG